MPALHPPCPHHETWTIDWLHEKHAVEGKQVVLKDASDDCVWTVTEVYRGLPQTESWVVDRRKAHTRWRQHTDV